MPDMGHSSLLVHDDSGALEEVYISFWPEMESVLRRVINLWKNRTIRYPASYAEESNSEAGFMQRPADFIVPLDGLREDRIRRGWELLKNSDFDVTSWNCANVSQCLLIAAMERECDEGIQDAVECKLADLETSQMDSDEMGGVLRYLAGSTLIGCCPEDVYRLVLAFEKEFRPPEAKVPVQAGGARVEGEP